MLHLLKPVQLEPNVTLKGVCKQKIPFTQRSDNTARARMTSAKYYTSMRSLRFITALTPRCDSHLHCGNREHFSSYHQAPISAKARTSAIQLNTNKQEEKRRDSGARLC